MTPHSRCANGLKGLICGFEVTVSTPTWKLWLHPCDILSQLQISSSSGSLPWAPGFFQFQAKDNMATGVPALHFSSSSAWNRSQPQARSRGCAGHPAVTGNMVMQQLHNGIHQLMHIAGHWCLMSLLKPVTLWFQFSEWQAVLDALF